MLKKHPEKERQILDPIHLGPLNPPLFLGEKNPCTYSSVPNRRVGRNKRAGGKILKKH